MTRRQSASETMRQAKAKRNLTLARGELRQESTPRISAAGPTSAPLKVVDDALRKMIDEALAKQ